MIKGIKFISIPVTAQDRALTFYTEKLGFRISTDQPMSPTQRWIELAIPGASTGVVLFTPEGHENRIGTFYPASFHCEDIDATYATLVARGVPLVQGSRRTETLTRVRADLTLVSTHATPKHSLR